MSVVTLVLFWKKVNSFCLNPSEEFCSYLISTIHCIMLKWGARNKHREREIKNGKKHRTGNAVTDRSWAQVKFCFHFSFFRSPCIFPIPHSLFPIRCFLGPFSRQVNNTRHDYIFFPRKLLTRQIYLACSTDVHVGIQIVGSAQRGVSRFVPPSTHLNVWNRLRDTRRKLTRLTQVVVFVIIFN